MPRAAPPAPPNTPESCRTEQSSNRDKTAAAGPEQTGLAGRAPAARSAAAAGSQQAARWQVRAAVSDPNCSRPAPGRPSGSGSAGAMSRVSRALREQRGGGSVRLDERRASRATCLSCGLCAQLAWASRYCGTSGPRSLDQLGTLFTPGNYMILSSCDCLLYTSPSPRDKRQSRMPSSA